MAERRYPKFPMAGVGAIVVGAKGVLLVKRDKEPGRGLWSIPGGVIELGFTVIILLLIVALYRRVSK